MTQAFVRTDQVTAADALARILTAREPFGRDADSLIDAGLAGSDQLFDRSNLIYAQTSAASRPTYIIGRKGAGKTAFLRGSPVRDEFPQEVLRIATVYAEMVAVLRQYRAARSPLFVLRGRYPSASWPNCRAESTIPPCTGCASSSRD